MRLGLRSGLAALAAGMTLACATALDTGERHYRDGDRLGALETWRSIPPDHRDFAPGQQRLAEVEEEFQSLVIRYKQRGRYFESRERLAESILNYRLALKLQPDDRETLDHVQILSRSLAAEKAATLEAFRQDLARRELGAARASFGWSRCRRGSPGRIRSRERAPARPGTRARPPPGRRRRSAGARARERAGSPG